jgi:hypothetical protein
MDCELDETNYEETLAAALQQASAEKILKGDILRKHYQAVKIH